MSFVQAVGRNTVIQFTGKAVGTVFGLMTAAMIQRYLAPTGFGAYTSAMAYLGFFSVLADLGLYLILVRDVNKPGADESKIIGNLLALRWASAGIILLAGAAIVTFIPFSPVERLAVWIGTFSFVMVAATQLLVGIFQTRLVMKYVVGGELLGRLILLGGTYAVIAMHGTLLALMVAVVAGSSVNFFMLWAISRRYVKFALRFDWPYWKSTLRDTLPIAISIVLNLIYFRADTIFLRFMKTEYDVGLYGAAYKILEILNTFPIMFVGLILPALGSAFAAADHERFRRIFQRSFELILIGIVPILIGGWILAEPALRAIGQDAYAPAAPVLRLLLVAVTALFLGSLSGHTVTIINRQRQMVWTYLAVAAIGVALYIILIPRLSLTGAAIGTIVTEWLTALVGYILILKVMKLRLSFRIVPRLLICALVIGGTAYLTRGINFWVAAAVCGALYAAAVVATRTINLGVVKEIISSKGAAPPTLPIE